MSESILNASNEKVIHKQGQNWDVVGRYEDFLSADNRRRKEIKEGRTAKVHKLSTTFVVKVKPTKGEIHQDETVLEIKKDRSTGKQKRQERDNKR